jgi:hypothetical protein
LRILLSCVAIGVRYLYRLARTGRMAHANEVRNWWLLRSTVVP